MGNDELVIDRVTDATGVVLALAGTVDLESTPALRVALLAACAEFDRVLLDVSLLRLLDSGGTRVLAIARKHQRDRGAELLIRGPRPTVLRLLELHGIADAVIEPRHDLRRFTARPIARAQL